MDRFSYYLISETSGATCGNGTVEAETEEKAVRQIVADRGFAGADQVGGGRWYVRGIRTTIEIGRQGGE
jgi:hypothetical protein